MDANTTTSGPPGYGQPALIGGLVMGVLSALPFVNLLNVCCCLWVVAGGGVAAYLLQQRRTSAISAGDGAIVGLLAGIVGAVCYSVISIPLGLLIAPVARSMAERALTMPGSNIPPEVRTMIENYSNPQNGAGLLVQVVFGIIGFVVSLIVFSIISTIGGLLGAAFFAKRQPPAANTSMA